MNIVILLVKVTLVLAGALVLVRVLGKANPRWRMLVCESAAVGLLVVPVLSPVSLPVSLPLASFGASEPVSVDGVVGAQPESEALLVSNETGLSADSASEELATMGSSGRPAAGILFRSGRFFWRFILEGAGCWRRGG